MSEHTQTWPELAIGLYEMLTEKKAEITYHFEDMKVEIPSGTGPEAQHALWKLDGKLRISTKPTECPPTGLLRLSSAFTERYHQN